MVPFFICDNCTGFLKNQSRNLLCCGIETSKTAAKDWSGTTLNQPDVYKSRPLIEDNPPSSAVSTVSLQPGHDNVDDKVTQPHWQTEELASTKKSSQWLVCKRAWEHYHSCRRASPVHKNKADQALLHQIRLQVQALHRCNPPNNPAHPTVWDPCR